MADWDDLDEDDFKPKLNFGSIKPQENWDDEDQESEEEESAPGDAKRLKELETLVKSLQSELAYTKVIKEKQKKKNQEQQANPEQKELTMEEKLLNQKKVEEADMSHTMDLFGKATTKMTELESENVESNKEVDDFAHQVSDLIKKHEKSKFYLDILKIITRDTVTSLTSEQLKGLGSIINTATNTKVTQEREALKGKKKVSKKKFANTGQSLKEDVYDSFGISNVSGSSNSTAQDDYRNDDDFDFM